jgi:hypothetical protein
MTVFVADSFSTAQNLLGLQSLYDRLDLEREIENDLICLGAAL